MSRLPFLLLAIVSAFLAGRVSARVDLTTIIPDVTPVVIPDDVLPVPGDGKHLAIIYETQDRAEMTAGQREILDSVTVRKVLIDGGWEVRYLDDDTEFTSESEWFKSALAVERQSLPWLVLSDGKTGYSGPLPETADAFLQLVAKHGG